ncbi:ABC transporter ATP-binding protein [Ketogulonicigenium vulgare]|uniref:Glutathione import ATP-binding protein GsiA n=1 Tax=Ketogulonicigenium vulgare (strain WSH-001) TaxID=759362 RepID=F9Y5K9_KETVW|nr:ABC transporter ATP-binding protein [Ketogulonicigenium vulgare]AEM40762.1 ABC transporter, nucleotide binding/ATPase protein [Ketogulonicigenium vulgare WSH-001]ALJ80931.1 glutathione ABC transporter ATP-binding protein [Ketogulonicigenium vulgare]ANW33702.1 glutathione ABC transporter ATP-binding protein GsiA [Ketogulonicigenium vulgare]AOZ54480.1 peptide ABC transporter [Ketogulonicigenium vulgare]
MTEPVLSIKNLTTSFLVDGEWKSVVRNISLDVMPGETVAIVGESGSGKSVTSLSVMGLLPKSSSRVTGSIRLNGQELVGMDEVALRRLRGGEMAMIFQEPMTSLNPVFPIGRQISEALTTHMNLTAAEARAETIRLLEKVRIPNAASRLSAFPHQFSGGMRQRVMIAMALACKPKLLIADEPTTALDVTIQGQILDLIKTLQEEEGMSVLFITHDMGVVAEVADRTVVMFRGDAVETGPTDQIFAEQKHPYTRALLAAVPRMGAMDGQAVPLRFGIVDKETGVAGAEIPLAAPVDTNTPVLQVRNLVTRFDITGGWLGQKTGAVHAVEDVSFDLFKGETLSLVGESGCGKSTIGRSIMRLTEAQSGEVLVGGKDARKMPRTELNSLRREIQMIFQDPFASLNPRMTIAEALAEPFIVHKLGSRSDAKEKAAALMQQVGLSPDMLRRYPHEFSGGQRQRISIARALVLEPKVIIADESVSALDVSVKAQVVNLLLDLQDRLGLSYLFISHDMAVVERVSHRVAVMYLGEIVEIGPRASLFANPQHPYTRKLMSAVPVPDPARRLIRRAISNDEIKSPIRPVGYQPPTREYREVAPGHLVRIDDQTAEVAA